MSKENPEPAADMDWIGDPSKSLAPVKPKKKPKRPVAKKAKAKPKAAHDETNPPAPTEDEIRAAIEGAPVVDAQEGKPKDAPPKSSDRGSGRGRRDRAKMEIWDGCPVLPLGVRGDHCYYLDVLGQLRAIKKHEAQTIQSLFGHQIPKLCYNFPQFKKDEDGGFVRVKNRFDQTTASMVMFAAVSECGVFNPDNAVRGVGAWRDDDDQLIYHMGDEVLVGDTIQKPGRIGKHIYSAQPSIPHPDPDPKAPDPVHEILDTVGTWNWTQPDLHPMIVLGLICTQMLGGALDWRPVFWLTAPAGAGKSELQKLMKLLHGDDGLVQTTDATKSGITSKLGHSSLPVSVDELEPGDERSTKERDIVQLARVAASGGEWFRGSADQTGVGGKVYSAFLFSSILIPGIMKPQDIQRLIRLDLEPLDKSAAKLNLQPRTWRARGARLKQLLIKRWPTFQARMSIWRQALELAGVHGRDADNWGTVLCMADMALQEAMPTEDVTANWAKKVAFVVANDATDTVNDAEAMLLHLMGQPYDILRRGEHFTVAQWVMVAAGLPGAPSELLANEASDMLDERRKKANGKLAKAGLRVQGVGQDAKLFIANAPIHNLKELFRYSDWAGGVWKQSAARVPGAEPTPQPLTLAGQRSRGYLLPIKSIPGLCAFPMDRDAAGVVDKTPSDLDDFG